MDTIIIHPGSLYLRIGRASDLNPEMILNCVARRRKGEKYSDTLLPPIIKTKELSQEMDEARINVAHMLQSLNQSDGRKRFGTPSQQV